MSNEGYKTIKVSDKVHALLVDIVKSVHSHGWNHIGLVRDDAATMSSVIEEGLTRLNKKKGK